ncbi:MAG: helix-turn-helix transcriptional regulator [Lentisphaerota bacterium]
MIKFPIPVISALKKLGQDISDARRRRRITMELMAERAGISRATLAKIEKGDPATSIGGYSLVLFAMGMTERIKDLLDANHDLIGRELEEERLPKRIRMPKSINYKDSENEKYGNTFEHEDIRKIEK